MMMMMLMMNIRSEIRKYVSELLILVVELLGESCNIGFEINHSIEIY